MNSKQSWALLLVLMTPSFLEAQVVPGKRCEWALTRAASPDFVSKGKEPMRFAGVFRAGNLISHSTTWRFACGGVEEKVKAQSAVLSLSYGGALSSFELNDGKGRLLVGATNVTNSANIGAVRMDVEPPARENAVVHQCYSAAPLRLKVKVGRAERVMEAQSSALIDGWNVQVWECEEHSAISCSEVAPRVCYVVVSRGTAH